MEELASARGIPFQAPIESAYVIEPKTHRIQDRVFNVEKKACVALFLLLFQSSAERERESVCVCVKDSQTHVRAQYSQLPVLATGSATAGCCCCCQTQRCSSTADLCASSSTRRQFACIRVRMRVGANGAWAVWPFGMTLALQPLYDGPQTAAACVVLAVFSAGANQVPCQVMPTWEKTGQPSSTLFQLWFSATVDPLSIATFEVRACVCACVDE